MAFEYLMAYYLLVGQLDRVVQNLGLLDNFDYQGVPAHYGEAILLYSARAGRMPDLKGRKIDHDTIERFNRFNRIMSDFRGDARAAIAALTTEMPNSYFRYYFAMAQSGGANETPWKQTSRSLFFRRLLRLPCSCHGCDPANTVPQEYLDTRASARISPDYSDSVIPPNIAPLNFVVKEDAAEYRVRILRRSGGGDHRLEQHSEDSDPS